MKHNTSDQIAKKGGEYMESTHPCHHNRYRIHVEKGRNGLDVYINTGNEDYYLTTRRYNGLILERLRVGVSIGELKRLKPRKSRLEQKYYNYTRHLLCVVNDFIKYDLTAAA